jgi:hypothetical protein
MDEQERSDIERAVYIDVREHFAALRREDLRRLDERFVAQEEAGRLRAEELARRLEVLNHAHEQAREKERDFISRETYETFVLRYQDAHQAVKNDIVAAAKSESLKTEANFERVDEKFNEYVKRYEARQREVDLLLSAQKGAAEEAKRAVEEQARKANRNLGIASLVLGLIVFAANTTPLLIR